MKKVLLFVSLLLLTFSVFGKDYRIVLNYGHTEDISEIVYHERYKCYLTAGLDGTIRVWDEYRRDLSFVIPATHMNILDLALHPNKTELAIIESDNRDTHLLTVWDWRFMKKKYSVKLDKAPLYLEYSPKGSYLYYATTDMNSIKVLTSSTGKNTRYLEDVYGISPFAVISGSEKNIMSYNVSGSLTYYSIQNSKSLKNLKVLSGLSNFGVRFSEENKLYMVSKYQNELVVTNINDGKIVSRLTVGDIHNIAYDREVDKFICYFTKNRKDYLRLYSLKEGKIVEEDYVIELGEDELYSNIIFRKGIIVLSDGNDLFYYYLLNEDKRKFAFNKILRVNDIAVLQDTFYVSTNQGIVSFESTAVAGKDRTAADSFTGFKDLKQVNDPYNGNSGIVNIDDNRCILWDRSKESVGRFALWDTSNNKIERVFKDFSSNLVSIKKRGEYLLVLEQSGSLKIYDINNWSVIFKYSAVGIQDIELLPDGKLIAGRTASSGFSGRSSLLQINTKTSETIPLEADSDVVIKVLYIEEYDKLVYVGIDRSDNEKFTNIYSLESGELFEKPELLFSYEGEDSSFTMAYDDEVDVLLASIGFEDIQKINIASDEQGVLEDSGHIARKVYKNGDILISINQDNSISTWDIETGNLLYDFYIFDDFNWIANQRERDIFYGSDNADRYINIYYDGTPYFGDKSGYLIKK